MDLTSLLQNTNYLSSLSNSLLIGLFTSCFSLFFGTIQAILLQRTTVPGKKFFAFLSLFPFLIPPYIHSISWTRILAPEGQLGKQVLPEFFIQSANSFLFSISGVIFILTLCYIPLTTVIISSGLRLSERAAEEAALLSHPPLSVLFKLTLPILTPYIAGSAMLTMILAMLNFSVPDILRVHVLPIELFVQLSVFYDQTGAFIMALPLIIVTIILILLCQYAMRGKQFITVTQKRNLDPVILFSSGAIRVMGWLVLVLLFCISVLVPLFYLISTVLSSPDSFSVIANSYSEITYSLLLCTASSCLTLIVALPIAYHLSRRQSGLTFLNFTILLPMAIPGPLIALVLLSTNQFPVLHYLSTTSILCLIGLSIHFFPFTVKLLEAELSRIDIGFEEIARLSNGSRLYKFKYILLPLLLPGLAISFLFTFIFTLGDLSIPLLLVPPGRETIPVKIYNLMHYGADEMVAALSLFLVVIMMSACFLIQLWYKTNSHRLLNCIK